MVLIDPELEHRDVFEAKRGAEITLNRIYAGSGAYDDLLIMTAAILNYWRKLRPYVMTTFTTYYKTGLKLLDEVEIKTDTLRKPKILSGGCNETRYRGVLTYEQGVSALQKLNEVYLKIGYGKIKPLSETYDLSQEAKEG